MLGRRPCRFFRVAALVHPVAPVEIVFLAAGSHELPDASRPGARNCVRLEGAFRLRQVDQVLRHALLGEHATDHVAIAPGAIETVFDNGPAARRREETQILKYGFVHRERQIVVYSNQLGFSLRGQARIARRQRHILDFVDRRGCGRRVCFLFLVVAFDRVDLVRIHDAAQLIEELAQPGVGPRLESALQDAVYRVVEVRLRIVKIPGLVLALARVIVRLNVIDQRVNRRPRSRRQLSHIRGICRKRKRLKGLDRRRCGSTCGWLDVDRFGGGLFAAGQQKHASRKQRAKCEPMFHDDAVLDHQSKILRGTPGRGQWQYGTSG